MDTIWERVAEVGRKREAVALFPELGFGGVHT